MKHITLIILLLLASPLSRAQKAMDLGLSVHWADRNVGASAPEEYGDYLAWGEVKPKRHYGTYSGYKHYDTKRFHKYNYRNFIGSHRDSLLTLEPKDDAATARLGKKWRMPTEAEMAELVSKCTFRRVKLRGANVYKVWNPTYAESDTIYLPCNGYKDYGNFRFFPSLTAYYWSSSLIGDEIRNDSLMEAQGSSFVRSAKCLSVTGDGLAQLVFQSRKNGCAVRAVRQ